MLPSKYKISDSPDGGYLMGPQGTPWITVCKSREDGFWCISENSDDRIPDSVRRLAYPTRELAAAVGLEICRSHDESMRDWAAPKELIALIKDVEANVREMEKNFRDFGFHLKRNRDILSGLRKAVGLSANSYHEDDLLKHVDSFVSEQSEYDKHPFFSEATLYPLLGKDDARTVLSLINEMKRRIDPINGT